MLASSRSFALTAAATSIAAVVALIAACSSDSTPNTAPTGTSSSSGGPAATCAAPGAPTTGTADTHCTGKTQAVSAASCTIEDAGTGGGDDDDDAGAACEYGPTQFAADKQGTDDDCKYKVSYTTTPICSGTNAVTFTVTVKNATDNTPATGIPDGLNIEAYVPTDPNAACDSMTTHPSPTSDAFKETTPGSGVYTGGIIFDQPGQWTVRFHIHEECKDILEDSPHGHIAFRLTVP